MCISRWPWDMFRWRWVTERGYHTGQPSVLDDLDSHLLQRRNWRGVGQNEFPRLLKAPWFYVLWAYLHETVSLFSRNKIPWPWWNYSSLSFFVLRQKMYYWFLIQPQTMWLREKSIEGGVRKPRFSPTNNPGSGVGGWLCDLGQQSSHLWASASQVLNERSG